MYALIENNTVTQYPYSFIQLRKDNPNTSYPRNPSDEVLENFGLFKVQPTANPEHDSVTQNVTEGTPELVDGVWTQTWIVSDIPEEEIQQRVDAAWELLRVKRNMLLTESDWTQLEDAPVDKLAWQAYRQSLRDLPENTVDPFNVNWPETP
jgi:hypothetical protein